MIFSSLYGTRLDRELGTDDSTILFTTARRKQAIVEGIREFADLTECFQRTATIAISTGVGASSNPLSLRYAEYNLNSTVVLPLGDFSRLAKDGVQFVYTDASSQVQVLGGDDLPLRDVAWLNRYYPGWQDSTTADSQLPVCHYLRDDGGAQFLGFYPVPSSGSSATMQAIVTYVAEPPALTSDTNEPYEGRSDLKPAHQAAVHYAAGQLEKLRRDAQASQNQMEMFQRYIAKRLATARKKGGRMVMMARNYFGGRQDDRGTDPRR